jgi:hypothetical protein
VDFGAGESEYRPRPIEELYLRCHHGPCPTDGSASRVGIKLALFIY